MANSDIASGLPEDKAFWGAQLLSLFDLTLGFEQVVLTIVPQTLFIFCMPLYVLSACKSRRIVRHGYSGFQKVSREVRDVALSNRDAATPNLKLK